MSYINTDVYGNFALAGSIFLDSRNSSTFADVFSLLYGTIWRTARCLVILDKYRSVDFLQRPHRHPVGAGRQICAACVCLHCGFGIG